MHRVDGLEVLRDYFVECSSTLLHVAAQTPDEPNVRVRVDEQFRTVVPNIFAAGDVIGYPSLAATSSEQGRLAACHALGAPASAMTSHFPIGIYAVFYI